jgi:hypothetical protein
MMLFSNYKDDLLDSPNTAFLKLEGDALKPEQELAEKYRAFVGEILRLSLAGIAVFAFLNKVGENFPSSRLIAGVGVIAFGFSILFSLWFLFDASEGLRWYIAALRYATEDKQHPADTKKAKELLDRRGGLITTCRYTKGLAALFLLVGSGCMAGAVAVTLFRF